MSILHLESCFAPAGAVRQAALGRWGEERISAYARWTLEFERPAAIGSAAEAVLFKILTRGRLTLASPFLEEALSRAFSSRAAAALKCAHRVQVAAMSVGGFDHVETDIAAMDFFTREEADALLELALKDLKALQSVLNRLYPSPEPGPAEPRPLFISFTGAHRPGWENLRIIEGWPAGARESNRPRAQPGACRSVSEADLLYLLRYLFRHESFRPGQAEALGELLAGRDVAVLLPTGAGKSLVYQMAGLLLPGTALIVEPLLALIEDQLRRLSELGITRAGAVTGAAQGLSLKALGEGGLAFCYVAPERLEIASFKRAASRLAREAGFGLVAVDEAHCVSEWGHDFRPAYLSLGRRVRGLCGGGGGRPPLAALAGTSSREALSLACRELGLSGRVVAPSNLSRPELEFRVSLVRRGEQKARLRGVLTREIPDGRFGPGLVFCPRVDGPLGAVEVAEELLWTEGLETGCYTGRTPEGFETDEWERMKGESSRRFLAGALPILVCTRAFGLGVHKPDIRFTAHLGIPYSLEGFYQEAGRAGRDGREAFCWIMAHLKSLRRARRWFSPAMPVERLGAELGRLGLWEEDDLSLALSLHLGSYPGIRVEEEDVRRVLRALGDPAEPRRVLLEMPGHRRPLERALSRLARAGVLEAENRSQGGVEILLKGGFSRDSALEAAKGELSLVYEAIEPARRRSLEELVEICAGSDPGRALGRRLAGLAG